MNERRSRGGAVVFSPIKRIILSLLLIALIASCVMAYRVYNDKKAENAIVADKMVNLKEAIQSENDKAESIKKSNNQSINDEDIEELAREELGLIKKDEIVIKPR